LGRERWGVWYRWEADVRNGAGRNQVLRGMPGNGKWDSKSECRKVG